MRGPVRVGTCAIWLALGLADCAGTHAVTQAAEGEWFLAQTPRFEVLTDGDPEVAADLAKDLERFHLVVMARTTATEREAAPPLRIFLAHSRGDFRALGGTKNASGIFYSSHRGNHAIINIAATSDWQTSRNVLFHEYVHYVISIGGSHVPSWYNEGLAEYMSTTEFDDEGRYTVGKPSPGRMAGLTLGQWVHMRHVLEADNIGELHRKTRDTYAQAWCAMHYLSSTSTLAGQLGEFLRLWQADVPSERAVERAFGMDINAFDRMVRTYAGRSSFDYLRIEPVVPLAIPRVDVRGLRPAEAHLRLGTLLLNTLGPTPAALEVLDRARAHEPDNGLVETALSRAHWMRAELARKEQRQADLDSALVAAAKHLERAQALSPDAANALTMTGNLHLTRAQLLDARGGGDEAVQAELKRSRNAYRKAIHANDALAEAYFGLGSSYLVRDSGSKEAVVVLEAAAFLVPRAPQVGLTLATVLMGRDQHEEAIAPLRNVLSTTKNDKLRAVAHAMLDRIASNTAAN
ncbi:MAG: hypothetical protein OEZ06_05790 [Myxococcales bacterium]|nr:hypothetical protein [Myxococcales bacterium]